jgi:hypothetical protein
MIVVMGSGYFDPHGTPRPCWHCRYFGSMLYAGSAAACACPGAARVRSMPVNGCSGFEREVGADDEPGPPMPRPQARTAQAPRSGGG